MVYTGHNPTKQPKPLFVALGVIKNSAGEVLIALRPKNSHQGGLWEFPGGKVKSYESTTQCLNRELQEELGISVQKLLPLIKIQHQYQGLKLLFRVYTVISFVGKPKGREGQSIKWINPDKLVNYPFPLASYPIITATRLPTDYAIINANKADILWKNLTTVLQRGIKLIQLRIQALSVQEITNFIQLAYPLCKKQNASLLLNSTVKNISDIVIDGIHLTSCDLLALSAKPNKYTWVAASCHNELELKHAEKIGVDFVVLAPVKPTSTHPNTKPLGWVRFKSLTAKTNLPVFALGGMCHEHKTVAQIAGAQGIAGISAFCINSGR